MTTAEVLALSGRELEAAVAEQVLGWLVVRPDGGEDWYERQVTRWPCLVLYRQGGGGLYRGENSVHGQDWHPSVDKNHAAEVEREVERRGLQDLCVRKLRGLVGWVPEVDMVRREWLLLTASAENRCRAALLAVSQEGR